MSSTAFDLLAIDIVIKCEIAFRPLRKIGTPHIVEQVENKVGALRFFRFSTVKTGHCRHVGIGGSRIATEMQNLTPLSLRTLTKAIVCPGTSVILAEIGNFLLYFLQNSLAESKRCARSLSQRNSVCVVNGNA